MTPDLPPVVPSLPPSISRPAVPGEDGGLISQPFAASNVLLTQMPEFLRAYFANTKIERPANLAIAGAPELGSYDSRSGTVAVDRSTDDPLVARHELLHALSVQHPRYRSEQYLGFGDLRRAVGDGNGLPDSFREYVRTSNDWPHIFVHLGELVIDRPDLVPDGIKNYFAPLLPITKPQRGPR